MEENRTDTSEAEETEDVDDEYMVRTRKFLVFLI